MRVTGMTTPPRILAIAGSDSSGGAGIQADIKTISMLGGYAMTAITAVTAQNTRGVQAVEVALEGAKDLPVEERLVVERLAEKAKYYAEAYKLARLVSEKSIIEDGKRQFVVCSGGGPSIMEAANMGASDAGAESIGLNIVLPHEQAPNPYVTPYLSLNFHYFALRKMHFLLRARAVAVFPGGFGTFDEFFELLTLVQTGKMKPIPILLFGHEFWNRVINFEALCEEGTISPRDLELFRWCETAEEAWRHIAGFYHIKD